jgi:hypothetical protein
MSVAEYKKILSKFNVVRFCGNISDPVFNPNFITFLKMSYDRGVRCIIHHAATGKPASWYREAFEANREAIWVFGIDGLPEESHIYRKNQDGPFLFDMMKMAKDMGLNANWAYIIFKYNENSMVKAKALADLHNIPIYFGKSSRFIENDPLKPTNPENYL